MSDSLMDALFSALPPAAQAQIRAEEQRRSAALHKARREIAQAVASLGLALQGPLPLMDIDDAIKSLQTARAFAATLEDC